MGEITSAKLVSFDTAVWTSKDGKLTVNVSYNSPSELIQKIYALNCLEPHLSVKTDVEMFEAVNEISSKDCLKPAICGKCGSDDTTLLVRVSDNDDKYYEARCRNPGCFAKLAYGVNKKGGGLFSKKYEGEGDQRKKKGSDGWVIYDRTLGKEV